MRRFLVEYGHLLGVMAIFFAICVFCLYKIIFGS